MRGNRKVLLYSATRSLDMEYHFREGIFEDASVHVPASVTHAGLYAAVTGLLAKRTISYRANIDKVNVASASVTLLYTDTTTEEGYLGEDIGQTTFALKVSGKSDRILSPYDLYAGSDCQAGVARNKAARNQEFNTRLTQRIASFSNIVRRYDPPAGKVTSVADLGGKIASGIFHETFHHSEQAIMEYLSSALGLKMIVTAARKNHASYVYGIVLDIYTQRMLCGNCNISLLGMQHSHEAGFLHDFSGALERSRIQPRAKGNLMLSTRVSASKADKCGDVRILDLSEDTGIVHEYHADKNNFVLQANAASLGVKKLQNEANLSLASYQGAFFVSRTFAKTKLEKAIALPAVRRPAIGG